MEPNPPDGCVPDVDFADRCCEPARHHGSVAESATAPCSTRTCGHGSPASRTSTSRPRIGRSSATPSPCATTTSPERRSTKQWPAPTNAGRTSASSRTPAAGSTGSASTGVARSSAGCAAIRRSGSHNRAQAPADRRSSTTLDTLSVDHRAVVVCRLLLGLQRAADSQTSSASAGAVEPSRPAHHLQPLLAPLLHPSPRRTADEHLRIAADHQHLADRLEHRAGHVDLGPPMLDVVVAGGRRRRRRRRTAGRMAAVVGIAGGSVAAVAVLLHRRAEPDRITAAPTDKRHRYRTSPPPARCPGRRTRRRRGRVAARAVAVCGTGSIRTAQKR